MLLSRLLIRPYVRYLALLGLLLVLGACSHQQPFTLTVAHLNDTHSHLEPTSLRVKVKGEKITLQSGGFARLKTVVDQMRQADPQLLLLHGGDAVQGTLYFTLFNGEPEFDFLNRLGLTAMTFGNHEFDRGIAPIPGWIKRSRFPWLSANIDFTGEPAIAALVQPYQIKRIGNEQVGLIGVTTETTPLATMQVGKAVFKDAVAAVRQQVAALTAKGVNKIILLSHLGYEQDKLLATQVAGLDLIVGGHSHTLLGDADQLAEIGLQPAGPYPTKLAGADGKPVLVLQAWRWGAVVGNVQLEFNPKGEVEHYTAAAVLPVGSEFTRADTPVAPGSLQYQEISVALEKSGLARVVAEDPQIVAALQPYARQLVQFRSKVVAVAAEELAVGLNSGPGPLVADSMLAAVPKAQFAMLNYGGVRRGLAAGPVSVADLLELLPFNDTLVLVDLSGKEVRQSLEETIEFLQKKFGLAAQAMPYLAGLRISVQADAPKGQWVRAVTVRQADGTYLPLQETAVYRVVVNSFEAKGGDGALTLKQARGFRDDTGIIDSDALAAYLRTRTTLYNPAEQRITLLPQIR